MIKKKKCRVCGFKFRLEKENRYLVRRSSSVVGALTEKPTIFEMFDCPQCGCQNAVGIYEQPIEENKKRVVMEFDSEKFKREIEENKKRKDNQNGRKSSN